MPIHEYECRECGARFDQIVSRENADDVPCLRCRAPRTRRLLSVIAGVGGRAETPAPTCGQGACGNC